MTGIAPQQPPTVRSFLAQKLERFRLAAREMHAELDHIDGSIKEIRHDLIMVIAALDALEEESKRDVA